MDSDSDTDSDTDADSDTDSDSDSDSDADSDSDCSCYGPNPEKFGDCDAGEDLEPTVTELVDSAPWGCEGYFGPTTPEAAEEIDYFVEDDGGDANGLVVFQGETGWEDFKAACTAYDPDLTEDDFPAIDFGSQRAVLFRAVYEYDCNTGDTMNAETRIGDLDDGTVQVNGYYYDPETWFDCEMDGFAWYHSWIVVLSTTSEVRACLEVAVLPPE